MMPLISFIVTYHNEPEAYLRACLESIHALPLAEDEAEIIVVDDGKTLSNSPLKGENTEASPGGGLEGAVLIRQEQAGLSVARNTGIANARGLYIQFVDADDQLIPSAYEAVIEQLRKKEADVVMFKMMASTQPSPKEKEMSRGTWLSLWPPTFGSPLLWRGRGRLFLQHRNLRAGACGYAFKREILGELRFYPGLLHEDELFTPQLFLKADTLVELDVKAYFYRQHSGTITHSQTSEQVQKRLNDIHFILNELKSLDNPLLERRVRQLTVDYLQKAWTLTHSFSELRRRKSELRKEGFVPLPLRRYSLRYLSFALLTKVF